MERAPNGDGKAPLLSGSLPSARRTSCCAAGFTGLADLFIDAGLSGLGCFYGIGCVIVDVWDRRTASVAHRLGNCWLVRNPSLSKFDAATHAPTYPGALTKAHDELPGPWGKHLAGGQMWTALILSTSFSEKYKGRRMRIGSQAQVLQPSPDKASRVTWNATLIHRVGWHEAVAFLWLGDQSAGDKTIYVAFSMMRKFAQAKKILWSTLRDGLEEDLEMETGWGAEAVAGPGGQAVLLDPDEWRKLKMASYMRRKIDKLWDGYGLRQALAECLAEHPGYRFIFSGISHGASLAQAACLRFKLAAPTAQAEAVTWNAYKWTDSDGSALAGRVLGDKMLPLALTQWIPGRGGKVGYRCWDSISGIPADYEPLPQLRLLDVDTGIFMSCEAQDDCPGRSTLTWHYFKRLWRLHYAAVAIVATRHAMVAALKHSDQGERAV